MPVKAAVQRVCCPQPGGRGGVREQGTQGTPRREGTALPAVIYYFCWSTVAPREWRESNV